jgi:hypothetical protein
MDRHTSRSQLYDEGSGDEDLNSEGDVRDSYMRESGLGSRASSLDSEEVALNNGRKALEEVAARLNDLEGREKSRTGLGKRGLGTSSGFTFMANLFNQRAQNNGIVVDEEDANQEDNPIADIFLWRFPVISAIWFSILQVLFFLFHFCDYSLLTVVSFVFLWQLVVDLALVKVVVLLQAKGIISEDLDIKDVIRKHTLFNPRSIKRVAATSFELSDLLIGLWRVTVYEANMSRVLIVGRFMFIVFFRSVSVPTTLWIFHMILFTIPIGYATNRIFADAVADGAHAVANEKLGRFKVLSRRLVDSTADRARHHYEISRQTKGPNRPLDSVKAGFWAILLGLAQNFDWLINKILG